MCLWPQEVKLYSASEVLITQLNPSPPQKNKFPYIRVMAMLACISQGMVIRLGDQPLLPCPVWSSDKLEEIEMWVFTAAQR